jgi:hypothetical protein
MATEYRGLPRNITAPPAAVNIASSTNATPIVVTTSTPHGLSTGDAFMVSGHLVNTNANGIWIAGSSIGASTVQLYRIDGNPSVGNGIGAATGTVRSYELGGFDIPEDAVDLRDASSVNVPFEANGDRTAFLWYAMMVGATPQRLADASVTISAHNGGTCILAMPTGARTITVQQATNPPREYQWIDFWLPVPQLGASYNIKREGSANVVVQLVGDNGNGQVYQAHARIHVENGVWRLSGGIGITPGLDA